MINCTPLTRDILDALASGPIDPNTRVQLARSAADRAGDVDQRAFAFEILKEESTWKDRGRARRARLALGEPRLQDRLMIAVSPKILELVDEIEEMTCMRGWRCGGGSLHPTPRRPNRWRNHSAHLLTESVPGGRAVCRCRPFDQEAAFLICRSEGDCICLLEGPQANHNLQ